MKYYFLFCHTFVVGFTERVDEIANDYSHIIIGIKYPRMGFPTASFGIVPAFTYFTS